MSYYNYLFIALGGAFGAILRVFLSSKIINNIVILNIELPINILIINIIGCFTMGLLTELMGVYLPASYNTRLFLVSGFLGGFTTFSAFSLEFGLLWQKGLYWSASLYSLFSFIFTILGFFLGIQSIKLLKLVKMIV